MYQLCPKCATFCQFRVILLLQEAILFDWILRTEGCNLLKKRRQTMIHLSHILEHTMGYPLHENLDAVFYGP